MLTEEQREQFRLAKEANREQGQSSRIESSRNGDLSKRLGAAAPKPQNYLENRSGEGTQRDNRDRVWKRIDSRYAPRDDHRENTRFAPRGRDGDTIPPSKETYNKIRYDESYAASRHREEARRAERKYAPISSGSKGKRALEKTRDRQPARSSVERAPEDTRDKQPARSSEPPRQTLEYSQMAKQIDSSPEHIRERPFKLSIQQKSSGDLKLKSKAGDVGDSSESVSSAKKSLKFATENKRPTSQTQLILPPANSEEKKKKGWYEITREEEEETLEQDIEADLNRRQMRRLWRSRIQMEIES
ncbi:hypothetical protein Bca101_067616 [Brassica carinata]